ncbi:hypothetical protein LWI29_027085 [Acer saccharum]|uniref:Gfo/Idh/MocA-like oxidoreductase N-terminal domain-containing protein n=1 Tax=Acer saccharum TaxID=4024 RepID=A0AA39SLV9_ACESA|nr:hypothetical protein LWI29_027085 [Acer saccharum]
MAENPIGFGIIGCAKIATKVARAIDLAPNSRLYAVGSRSINKAKSFAAVNGLSDTVKLYGSYDQVLDDPCVDVVYLPLPTSLHVHWAELAARKKKHLLLEKPTALDVTELDRILEACESNGVQFMDGSMWLHHPRTVKMKEMLFDSGLLGQVHLIHSTATSMGMTDFFENNIRVKADLDALGALGDLGWYCIGATLWSKNYKLPTSVTALPDTIKNSDGVILSCTASLHYYDDDNQPIEKSTTAIIHCSFLSYTCTDLSISASKGSLHLKDFIIPFQEDSAFFNYTLDAKLVELHIGWNVVKPEKVVVDCELPQEPLMVQELARIVEGIKKSGCRPDSKWPEISRKTQLVMDAIKQSVDLGCKPVYLTEN